MSLWTPSRTVMIGKYRDDETMRKALGQARRKYGSSTARFLAVAEYPQKEEEVVLVKYSNRQLGLRGQRIPRERTYAAALEAELQLCHWADAAHLAAVYDDQPGGELLHVAMELVSVEVSSFPFVLHNQLAGGLWFRAVCMGEEEALNENSQFLFRDIVL